MDELLDGLSVLSTHLTIVGIGGEHYRGHWLIND